MWTMYTFKEVEVNTLSKLHHNGSLTQFLHDCVNDFLKKHNTNDNHADCSPEDKRVKQLIYNLYSEWVSVQNFEPNLKGLSKSVEDAVIDCFFLRKDEIFQEVAKQTCLDSGTKNLVQDFDYKLKWVLGNSKVSSLKEALLQVDFNCCEKDENEQIIKNVVSFESNLEMVDKLIAELEKVNLEVQTMSS